MLPHTRRFIRRYMAPLWAWYLVGTVAVLVTNALSVTIPSTLAQGLDALLGGDAAGVANAAYTVAGLGVAVIVTRWVSRVLFFTPGRQAEFNLREDLFGHALRLQPDFYARMTTGDLMSRVTSDVTNARAMAGFALLQGVNVVVALSMGYAKMAHMSPLLTVGAVLPGALAWLGMQRGTRRLFTLQRETQALLAGLSDELLGTLQAVGSVQGFCVEEVFVARLSERSARLRDVNLAMTRLRVVIFPLLNVAAGISVVVLLWVGGEMVVSGALTQGDVVAFAGLIAFVLTPMRLLGFLFPVFQRAEASLERIDVVFDTVPERPDLGVGRPFPSTAGPAIELRGLTYTYPDGARPVLQDLTVTLPAGSTVGIYGPTGSGKTTLLRLLSRLRNPPRGMVFLDGVDLCELDLDGFRAQLSYVTQTPFLFSETIRENVGLGEGDAAVRTAVEAASLGPDLATLPDGLETIVGERGITLSGGQRQRVALARGLVRHRPIVLLDDVISAVDHQTERELLAMLRKRSDATRIIVSHRLSALEDADLVLVLDEGRLVDQGTHEELLTREGPYRTAWLLQREEAA